MKNRLSTIAKFFMKEFILTFIGGCIYSIIEILFRGYTHWTMIIVGGVCFAFIGLLNEFYTFKMSVVSQMFLSSIFITLMEFISGIFINLIFKLNVWDYSDMPYNVLGQICLPFAVLWFFLSLVGIVVDDYLRYIMFNEEKPNYKWL